MIRVFTYRRGCKVCPGCDKPLDGLRRDARGHDACMRAIRRRCTARASKGRVARQSPAQGHVCPGCGGDVLLVRVLAFGVLSAAQSVVLQGERSVSGRKVATCACCEWRGTVARTREAVAA